MLWVPRSRLAIAIVFFATTGAASAQTPPPGGPEVQVNVVTAGDQSEASVAAEAGAGYVVVWRNGATSIAGRRFDATGTPRDTEFAVNVAPAASGTRPVVAAHPGGGFAVVWEAPDAQLGGIFARRFDAAGQPVGPEVAVNAVVAGLQTAPRICAVAQGYVVVWMGPGVIVARMLDAGLAPLTAEINVSAGGADPDVAGRPSGFAVTWSVQAAPFATVNVRLFDSAGAPLGPVRRANEPDPFPPPFNGTFYRDFPRVASAADGSLTVTWHLHSFGATGGFMPAYAIDYGAFVRRFDTGGSAIGPEAVVNQYGPGWQRDPAISASTAGTVLVAWSSVPAISGCIGPICNPPEPPPPPQDGSGAGVYARLFDPRGADIGGGEFRINASTIGDQRKPAVAMATPSSFLAVFQASDGSGVGLFARRFGFAVEPVLFEVDFEASGNANGNGVLEPGEQVVLAPAWRNLSGAPQRLTSFALLMGPAGPSYQTLDNESDFGLLADGAAGSCRDSGNCFLVSAGGARPAPHWDAQLAEQIAPVALLGPRVRTVHVGDSFADVPRSSVFNRFVETVFHHGVMDGCATGVFCPVTAVTRELMASYVLRAVHPTVVPPACVPGAERFADVPASSVNCRWIEELARRGVVAGCGAGNYCPLSGVSREQLAVYLLVTREGTGYAPPACGTPMFADLPASSGFCRWVEELARRGIVAGCGDGNYCPVSGVSREEMSVFLSATFGLVLYAP